MASEILFRSSELEKKNWVASDTAHGQAEYIFWVGFILKYQKVQNRQWFTRKFAITLVSDDGTGKCQLFRVCEPNICDYFAMTSRTDELFTWTWVLAIKTKFKLFYLFIILIFMACNGTGINNQLCLVVTRSEQHKVHLGERLNAIGLITLLIYFGNPILGLV